MYTKGPLVFYVNGKKVQDPDPDPGYTLLYYLRKKLCLTGTKLGCGEGGCGACTVMVSKYLPDTKTVKHFSANACLIPICSLHGMAVTTVEGIGSIQNGLHPVQERIAKSHGSQCGFCTPGIVMSMYTLLRNNPQPTGAEMENAFEGNLCRCTGYRPILEGFKSFTKEFCQMGENCCKNTGKCTNGVIENGTENGQTSEYLPLDSTQDPIFPPELRTDQFDVENIFFKGEKVEWYRPTTLKQLLDLKGKHPDAKLVIGNTEVGLEVKLKNMNYPVIIGCTHIAELNQITQLDNGVKFGSSVTLTDIENTLKTLIKELPDYQTRVFQAIVEILRWFAGHQIRNVAAVGGNIITASPISDLNPLFLAAGAVLQVESAGGSKRNITMDDKFFLGYRKTALKSDEVLLNVTVPFTRKNEYFGGYKQANRREDDIAIVNAGFRVLFEDNTNVIKEMAMAFGGMAPTTVMAVKTMKEVVGRKWDDSLIDDVCRLMADDLQLTPGAPGGMVEYRRTLTTSFFFKFYLTTQLQLQQQKSGPSKKVPKSFTSATPNFHRDPSKGSQIYEEVAPGQPPQDAVGRPLVHLSAMKQATGEAIYVDDMPSFEGELYLALVTSTQAHAKLLKVDPTKALSMTGVVDFISHKDVPGHNTWGIIPEESFASTEVLCIGHIIGAVVADTQAHAQAAAKAVHIEYEKLDSIITIKEAIAKNSYWTESKTVNCGDTVKGFEQADHVIEGEVHVGGQEHFYLETNATLAVPKNEDGEMELFVSTQNPTETQLVVAETLGVAANKILVRVKRLGGGFGGKETRSICLTTPVALAAYKLKKPVRCMLDRDEDMLITGTRHPFLGQYKVGFTKEGKVVAAEVNLYNNAGCTYDLSEAVLDRGLYHLDNAYKIANLKAVGRTCKTNIPSNTAFRGFGGPQGMLVAETFIDEVATYLNFCPSRVRKLNMYNEGDLTHFGQVIEQCNIKKCWEECKDRSEFIKRKRDVEIFNSENRWKKRGICMIPTKFGIAFTATFLNQAGALVMVYRDGSVLVTHGGVEMGQGLHTKMIQVASRVLKIPTSKIHISETSTNTVPNTSATAASASSDLNGMAVKAACQTILERIEPYINANPKGSWEDWVNSAYFNRVSLSSTGFYKTPGITGFDFEKQEGRPFDYFTFGASCSEVEIDCLTGDHQVLRTDIVMDVGCSLNPAIDIGQIEGGFMQGYGMMLLEQQKISPDGFLFTRGPSNYKIPGFGDIPVEFNVSLLKGSINQRAVYSSKAIGEPPLFLSAAVFFAVKDAIRSARVDSKQDINFTLHSPATAERIRMACKDQFTEQFPEPEEGSYKPWFVNL
ncbi:xanthine dehydrogenase/oxidase-like isoform X1 [Mytilus californianus]|uniref:xanthine dehydrogenase/oxidase-like isoform X1 n=2 Tax=Mytilus californianus TaxID=6549 RepID=UPI0022468C4F|nr:xanthine dehydrogenase/oxidase-like isoform X1 [Mytilus californianus]